MIDVQNLNYRYADHSPDVLHQLSFSVSEGEIFGFLGPSGAGKSTTQKILTGLLTDYRGTITVMQRELAHWGADYYEHIGVSFELPNHYLKLTAIENLSYFGRLYRHRGRSPQELLEMVGLGEDGHKRVSDFSKGMRNRLTLARALVHRPRILFLDEPTAGLDPVNTQRVKELILAERAAGTTVFLTTHNMSIADQLCDRVAFIVDGQIQLIDRPRELRLRYGRKEILVETGDGLQPVQQHEFAMQGLADNQQFLQLLRHPDLQTVHTQETTLEKIFIEITGRQLN